MLKHTDENFQVYPTNRVVAIVDSRKDADGAVSALIDKGFDHSQIDESYGKEGMMFLDPDGEQHGLLNLMIRRWQQLSEGEVHDYVERIKTSLKKGQTIVSVPAKTDADIDIVSKIMHTHHAEDIRYYGQDEIKNLK